LVGKQGRLGQAKVEARLAGPLHCLLGNGRWLGDGDLSYRTSDGDDADAGCRMQDGVYELGRY
jgi:hypothetical protein